MDESARSALMLLLHDAEERRSVSYRAIGEFFPKNYPGGTDLDEVLSRIEGAGIEILAPPMCIADLQVSEDPSTGSDVFDDDPVQVYTREVETIPAITTEREAELFSTIQEGAGARPAAKELMEAHLGLALSIARGYQSPGFHLLDLIQEGNSGVVQAVDAFRPKRGYRLSTFVAFWVHRRLDEMIAKGPPAPVIPVHRR